MDVNHYLGTEFFVHQEMMSAGKRVEFIGDRMSYIRVRSHWRDIVFLNVHAPTEDKSGYMKDSLYEELQRVFDQQLKSQ
jgi:hypothetical protein